MSFGYIKILTGLLLSSMAFGFPEDLLNSSVQSLSAESCKSCHSKQHAEWSLSKHKMSYTNALFQKNYEHEKHDRCLKCHLPLQVQRSSVGSISPKLHEEGVTCSSCHSTTQGKAINDSKMCSKCHQFNFLNSEIAAQNTYKEWQKYASSGGTKRCQDCHMKNGSHDFKFSNPKIPFEKALKISIVTRNGKKMIHLKNEGAGHNIPTGDIYRHIQLQIEQKGIFTTFYSIGRNPYFLKKENKFVWKNHNSIAPGQTLKIDIPLEESSRLQVVYFREAAWAGRYYFFSKLAHHIIFETKL